MSQTGTPTEFLGLGITEPDDTLNVLVDLNGQWQKIDTGVKNVDTKANTNASGITALNTAVQDNTENITNILETNVNQQNSIDTLQSKVATLEEDDSSYGSRITAVEAGVQENSELINDLEVELSGVETSVGTVPSGSTLQGQVDGLDTRVTTLENSGSVAAVEARVTTLETEVGTVPSGETVQGQITTLNGQVNSGNIPFRFSVDGGGNYGYLKADDSFVPFRSGSGDSHWHVLDTTTYITNRNSLIVKYKDYNVENSPYYRKLHNLYNDVDYTLPSTESAIDIWGNIVHSTNGIYLISASGVNQLNNLVGVIVNSYNYTTHYLTRSGNTFQYNCIDIGGNSVGVPVNFNIRGNSTSPIAFYTYGLVYRYNSTTYLVNYDRETGTTNEQLYYGTLTSANYFSNDYSINYTYEYSLNEGTVDTVPNNKVIFKLLWESPCMFNIQSIYYYYV